MNKTLYALALSLTTVTGVPRTPIEIMMGSVSATKTGVALTARIMMANATLTVKAAKALMRTIASYASSMPAGLDHIPHVNVMKTGPVMTVATGLVSASLLVMAVLAQIETTVMTAYYTLNVTEL
jgi:hypothetical protein